MTLSGYRRLWAPGAVGLAALACRPVITIGWAEIAIIAGVFVLLLAPFLVRVVRFLTRLEDKSSTEEED